jgi:teichuronic acid biosynthesis glycosyltransferase TuaH
MMPIDGVEAAPIDDLPLVVMCAGSGWTAVTGSDHHLARELTRYARVLWVDPPVSVLTRRHRRHDTGRLPWPRLRPVTPRLTRLTTTALPGHSRPVIHYTTGVLVRAQIRWALRRLGLDPAAIVACMLDDVLTGWPPGVCRVLYGTDDYAAGAELMGLNRDAVLRNERRQLASADVVVAVSQVLVERWSNMGAKVLLIPNGVQAEAYGHLEKISPALDVSLPAPVAGMIGQFSARIDIGLLEAIADSGCSLLLVGPHDPNWESERFTALIRRERVEWVGRREFEELPTYLRRMDVGLTPYVDIPFNRASFPLKTLEYLAAGLPVVSSRLPATQWLDSDLVRVADGPDDFVRAVREAARERSDERLICSRRAFAQRHSWKRRAEELVATMGLARTERPQRETN